MSVDILLDSSHGANPCDSDTGCRSVSGLPQLLPQLEGILFPIMQRMVSTEGQDVFEDVLEIVAYFTFFSPEVPSRVFSLIVLLRGCR